MLRRHGVAAALVLAASVFMACDAYAMGKGKTKVDFQVKGDEARFFAKRDVAAGVNQLPEAGSKSKNDNLAGHTVTLTITQTGGTVAPEGTLSGVASEKGKVTTPFDGKLTANGGIMQIKTTSLDIVKAFPLDMTDGEHTVTVQIKITAQMKDPSTGAATGAEIVLSDEPVTFNYKVKKGAAKGKNF